MRLPFLRPKSDAADAPVPKARARSAPQPDEGQAVAAARSQARRRLVGALVLLATGIVAFPVLFETQPRPLPLDTPIETAARPPAAAPAPATPRPQPVPTVPADTGAEPVAEVPPAASVVASAAAAPGPASVPVAAPVAAASAPPVAATATEASAPTLAASSAGRFVVQVGAYTDVATLREARAKVEKLGLKTYTQVIDNDAGKRTRVRIGPFATRDEAEAAAAKVKRTGLPANILVL
jgi:DedD protein